MVQTSPEVAEISNFSKYLFCVFSAIQAVKPQTEGPEKPLTLTMTVFIPCGLFEIRYSMTVRMTLLN